nr:hypothetical protein BaRGS_014015 [Batillaria attramentaria]
MEGEGAMELDMGLPAAEDHNMSEEKAESLSTNMTHLDYPVIIESKPLWEIVVKTVFYVPIISLAIIGNVLVILVVARNKRMRTTTNYYIVNLAVADCLVALTCSWVHLLDDLTPGWVLGAFFCKFNTFTQVLSLVSSILTLTFIAWDRFFGIVFAMKAHFIERRASLTIVILWLLSIGVASPLLVYREYFEVQWRDYTESWCDDEWPIVRYLDTATNTSVVDIPARRYYYVFVCVVLFFLPCLVMSLAYALIICTLWSSQVPGERTSKDIKLQTKLRKKFNVQ